MRNFIAITIAAYLGFGAIFGFIRFVSAITWISFGPDTGLGFVGGSIYGAMLLFQALFIPFVWPLTVYSIYIGNYTFLEAVFFPWFTNLL